MEASVAATPAAQQLAVAVSMTPAEYQVLQELAQQRGTTPANLLREALAEKKFFSDQRRSGNEVVLKYPNGALSTVKWSYD